MRHYHLSAFLGCALTLAGLQLADAQSQLTEHTLRLDESTDVARLPAALSQLSWLEGCWRGAGLGGTVDEMWGPAIAGTMLGTFRLTQGDQLSFTEFFMMSEEDETVVLRLKHFNPDFTGWEPQDKYVTFRLIRIEGKTAWFDRLTYALQDNGELHVYVAMKQKDGSMGEAPYVLQRER